jgi:hypothetical protein
MVGVQKSQKAWQIAKEQRKNENLQRPGGPSPKEDGSWIIQTHQGRWMDPGSQNPRSKAPEHRGA